MGFKCIKAELFKMIKSVWVRASYTKKNSVKDNVLGPQCLQRTSCCFLEASNWCPGHVSSQYLTSTRCISLVLPPETWLLQRRGPWICKKKDDTRACPACACLTVSEKEPRHHFAENKELKMVTWDPTWEPEEMAIHADFEKKV